MTKLTTKNTSAASSVSGKKTKATKTSKTIAKAPKTKSTEFTKNIKLFRNQKEYFALDDNLRTKGFATRAIYGGWKADPLHGGVTPSIDLSSTFA